MTGKSAEVTEVLAGRGVKICCVQETRWKGKGTRMVGKDEQKYKFVWSGAADGCGGVGILVAEELVGDVVEVTRVNDRMIIMKIVVGEEVLNVMSVYAPQNGKSEEEKERFWQEMEGVVSSMKRGEKLIIGGDFNAHVGRKADGYEGVHGGYGHRTRNIAGERMLEFCDVAQLIVANTMFAREAERIVSYESGGNRTTVDYFLIPSNDTNRVHDAWTMPEENV